jgi:cell division protein FtsI/penicillin-binding protein 2
LSASQALAASCNQFFYQLSKRTDPAAFFKTLAALGIRSGAESRATSTTPETMIGLDAKLRLLPLQVLKAYAVLVSGHASAEANSFSFPTLARADLLAGLALGVDEGTSALAQQALPPGHTLLGKTGTSPALAGGRYSRAKTDGWFLGLYPRSEPVLAVMVYYPNGLGAKDAAPLGGRAIKLYLETVRQTDGP